MSISNKTQDICDFKLKLKGIPAYKIAMAMTRLQHGIDFSRCTKEMLADSWANRNSKYGHAGLRDMTLDQIVAKIEEIYPNGRSTSYEKPAPPPPRPTKREAFETWLSRVRVQNNFQLLSTSDGYKDMDVDWLWKAYQEGSRRNFI